MKKAITICLITACMLALTSCGRLDSCKTLYKNAEAEYGECELISQTSTKDTRTVVLRDNAQGFVYEVQQEQKQHHFLGEPTYISPQTTNDFNTKLLEYVQSNIEDDIKVICESQNIPYRFSSSFEFLTLTFPDKTGRDEAELLCEKCADIIEDYNYNNRLNECTIIAKIDGQYISPLTGEELKEIGSFFIKDMKFHSADEIRINELLVSAEKITGYDVTFVRAEYKPVKRSGSDIETNNPKIDPNSYTIYCYYTTPDGKEYFICEFPYNYDRITNTVNDEKLYNEYYTNYVSLNESQYLPKGKSAN